MIDNSRIIKVSLLGVSIIYVICFLSVAMFPEISPWFMMYGLHTSLGVVENVATIGTFISGLIIWNLITALVIWLFTALFNKIKN